MTPKSLYILQKTDYRKEMNSRLLVLGIIAVIIVAIASFYYGNPVQLVNVPLTSLQEKLSVYTLQNGMTVTIKEQHSLPLVTIQFWVHTGARNEPDARRGIAHIFEHIWFKGTATQPVGSFHKRVESLGGELNAMTSHDWTMYFVTVPSDKFNDIFPNMVDLLLHPSFDPIEIEKEKEVVVEEQRFSFNEPEKYLDDQFGLLLLDKSPYRNPVIGYKDTILGTTREDIIQFYNTWYVPNNMNIVLVGDVNKEEILNDVKEAFKDFEKRELPAVNNPTEDPILQPRYNSSYKDIGHTYIALGFTGPDSHDKDKYAMMMLNTIFSGGESSRLQRIAKQQKNLIVKGNSVFVPLNDLGVFEVVATVEPEKSGEAKTELILLLNKFKTEYVTDDELERAKNSVRVSRVRAQEEVFNAGFEIGQAWTAGDINEYSEFINEVNKVTKEDIKNAAKKYFNSYTMYELKPKL